MIFLYFNSTFFCAVGKLEGTVLKSDRNVGSSNGGRYFESIAHH
ncbi:MAG: hypothetical protein AAF960_21855 [Bacteroidota bacterium]